MRATLTRDGRVLASATFTALKGALKLTLTPRRTLKPGTYTLNVQLGAKRTTRTAIVA